MEGLADFIQTSLSCDQRSTSAKDEQCVSFETQMCNSQEQIRESMAVDSMDVVQQREVSSSKPSPSSLLNHNVVGPLLLQALDGFLLIINSDGIIEFVSDNISHYLNFSVEDLMGKSIYRFLHPASHQFFGGCLESLAGKPPLEIINNRNFSHEAKFRVNTADEFPKELDDSNFLRTRLQFFHQKSRRMSRDYDFSPSSPDTENQSYLVCIAQRIGLPVNERNSTSALNLDQCQFTTKQDLQGKILNCDSSSLRTYLQTVPGSITIRDFVGKNVLEFCHPYDKDRLRQHHEEVVKNGTNMSGVYRFQILKGKYVFVQTKSKLFKNPTNNKPEFIMSTHSIVRMCDSDAELKGSAEKGLMQAIIGPTLPNHRDSFWMNSLSDGGPPSSSSSSSSSLSSAWKDVCLLPNSSMLLPPPDTADHEPSLQWNQNHPPFSRSYSAVGPQFTGISRPSSVASDQSPQHVSNKNAPGVKRTYKRKRSSPSSDVRNKNIFYEGLKQNDLIISSRLSKKSAPLSISNFSLEDRHRTNSNNWESMQQQHLGGVLPPLQALQQLQASSPSNSVFKPETSVYSAPVTSDRNILAVFSPTPESNKFFQQGRFQGCKGEGLRALLTASDEDDFKNDYEINPIKALSSSLLPPCSSNSLDRHKESTNCFNRSPPQEPQSTTHLGENPNSPKRGQSPGRCNLLMNLLTGATDDEDEDAMKVNESKNKSSMRILAKLETLQSMPDTSKRNGVQTDRSEVESTSENNTLLKALLKSNSEGDKPTKKADILSKLLSDNSDDVFIHPATEISSTVGNDSEGIKLFLTSSNLRQSADLNISQKSTHFSDTISSLVNMESASQMSGSILSGGAGPALRRNISCTSTIPAITSSLMTAPEASSPASLLSVASTSLSFLISCSNSTVTSNSSAVDNAIGFIGDKRPPPSGNCKLLKELLSTQPAPQNIVNPCRISALPMAAPQSNAVKKSQNLSQSAKVIAESISLDSNKVDSVDHGNHNQSRQTPVHDDGQGNDLSGFLDDNDMDLETILSSITSAPFDFPIAEDIEPLMMSQIEHAIMTADLSAIEIDQLINNSDCKESNKPRSSDGFIRDKIAISEIQHELMKIGTSKLGSFAKPSSDERSHENGTIPSVIPQVKNQNMDMNIARTSLMTVAHKGPEEPMMTTCGGGSLRRKSVDPPVHIAREVYGENSLQHFKDMMNVSIAPNVIAPRTSIPMTLGQLLNRSSKAATEQKDGSGQRTPKTSGESSSQMPATFQDSAVPRSPMLPPVAPIINRRGSSLSMGIVPGSLQALHQHNSLTQLNLNQNSQSSPSSSIISFKSESEDGKGLTLYNATASSASISTCMASKSTVHGTRESSAQRMVPRQTSLQLDGGKALANGSASLADDDMLPPPLSSSSLSSSMLPLKSSTSTVNAKLALKGVLQGRSQNNQNNQLSNQVITSAKISDTSKLQKKPDEHIKLLLQQQQQQQVYFNSLPVGRQEDSLDMGLMSYAFQSNSSDLDDLEVIIAQEEKESRQYENHNQIQVRNSGLPTVANEVAIQSLGIQNSSNENALNYGSSNTGLLRLQISNSTLPRQVNPAKVGYISVNNAGQQVSNQQNIHSSFVGINGDIGPQLAKSQEGGHKIVFLGEQDKLYHLQVGSQIVKHQLVPQQPQQLFLRQQQVSQPNILLHQPISYQASLPNLPQHLIFGQRLMNRQDQHLQHQFGSNVNQFHQVQLQPSQQETHLQKSQQAIIFQQECPRPGSHLIIQQNAHRPQNFGCRQPAMDSLSSAQQPSQRPVLQQKGERINYESSQSVNSTPIFGADCSDIGNLEDDEIYQLISALSNEESAFCLSQLSEEAMNWAENGDQSADAKGKEMNMDINKIFNNKDMNTNFLQSEIQNRAAKNVSSHAGRYVNFVSGTPNVQRADRGDVNNPGQPKRHAMLEKLLAE